MQQKVGRNDPCPCGSGKKYKACCLKTTGGRKKIKAKIISSGSSEKKEASRGPDLMERTFGEAIRASQREEKPPVPEKESDTNASDTEQ